MGRFKIYKRFIGFYKIYCGLKEPLRILCDELFLKESIKRTLNLQVQFSKILPGCKICITKCVEHELGDDLHQLHNIEIIDCHHTTPCKNSVACFLDYLKKFNIKNGIKIPYNYGLATQMLDSIEELRKTRFPIFCFDQQILKLNSPSSALKRMFLSEVRKAQELNSSELSMVKEAQDYYEMLYKQKNKEFIGEQEHLKGLIKVKKAKGPNPLSMKKKNSAKPKKNDEPKKIRRGTRGNTKERKKRRALKRLQLNATNETNTTSEIPNNTN